MKAIDLSEAPSRRRAFAWHLTGGWLSNFLLILQGFLLVPLYLIFLGERLYGFWLASGGLLAWIAMVDVGCAAITKVRCANAYARKDLKGVVDYFWHGGLVMAGVLALYLLIVFTMAEAFTHWLGVDEDMQVILHGCFQLAGIAGAISLANNFLRDFSAALQQTKFPALLQAGGDIINLTAVVLCLVFFDMGLWALPVGLLCRSIFAFTGNALNTKVILSTVPYGCDWSKVIFRDYLRTTPSILAAKGTSAFSTNLPNILLAKLLGPEVAVIYTVTSRLAQAVQQFINHGLAASYAAYSHLFGDSEVAEDRKRVLLGEFSLGFVVVAGCGVVGYTLLNEGFVALWTSQEQFAGQWFVGLMAAATFMLLRSRLLMGMLFSADAMRSSSFVSSLENLLQAGLMIAGVYMLGLPGIPLAIIVSALLVQLLYLRAINRKGQTISRGLFLLQWAWIPVVIGVAVAIPLSRYLIFTTWTGLIFGAISVAVCLGAFAILSLPFLRVKFRDFTSNVLKAIR